MKIKTTRIRQTIAFILLLFYPFNNSISDKILFGNLNAFIFLALGVILLLPNLKIQKRTKIAAKLLPIVILSIIYILLGNRIFESELFLTRQLLTQISYLLILPVISSINIDTRALKYAMIVYAVEHIIGTAIPIIAPAYYSSNVLPFICAKTNCFARSAFLTGKNAGLTGHYTTNGVYMAIFALYFVMHYIQGKDKKSLIIGATSLLALLIIGKRAHFLFTLIALLLSYIVKNKNFSISKFIKNNLKLLIVAVAAIIGVSFLSTTIPQINTTLNRLAETKNSDDISNGREPLYEVAKDEWAKHPIVGNGWGHYIHASHKKFGEKTYGTDYIHAHNDFLEILCDKGIIGISLYCGLLIWLLLKSYRMRSKNELTLFSLSYIVFYVLYSFTGTPISIPANYVFLLVSILIVIKEAK